MKKSVNGKTFDEIFEQRGKEATLEEMVKGRTYLFEQLKQWGWFFLGEYSTDFSMRGWIGINIGIWSTGGITDCDSISCGEVDKIFEATPDQIDLLNAYKNE